MSYCDYCATSRILATGVERNLIYVTKRNQFNGWGFCLKTALCAVSELHYRWGIILHYSLAQYIGDLVTLFCPFWQYLDFLWQFWPFFVPFLTILTIFVPFLTRDILDLWPVDECDGETWPNQKYNDKKNTMTKTILKTCDICDTDYNSENLEGFLAKKKQYPF